MLHRNSKKIFKYQSNNQKNRVPQTQIYGPKQFENAGRIIQNMKSNSTNKPKKAPIPQKLNNVQVTKQVQSSNFEWHSQNPIFSLVFDKANSMFVAETGDVGKIVALKMSDGIALKENHTIRLQKLKQIIKGIENAKIRGIISIDKPKHSQVNLVALELLWENCLTAITVIEKNTGDLYGIYHYQKEITSGFIKLQNTNGIISILQHGMQQFLVHLNPIDMESNAIPLFSSTSNQQKISSLKLIDLHNSQIFGIIQDDSNFTCKSIHLQQRHFRIETVSSINFESTIQEIVPINKTESVIIKIDRKFLIYDYIQGVTKTEIQSLRNSDFRVCLDLRYHADDCTEILLFNKNTIRRVDVKTLEIKKNIDLSKFSKNVSPGQEIYIHNVFMVPDLIMPPNSQIVEQSEIEHGVVQAVETFGIPKPVGVPSQGNASNCQGRNNAQQDKESSTHNWKDKYDQIKRLLKQQQQNKYGPDKNAIPRPLVAPTNLGGVPKKVQQMPVAPAPLIPQLSHAELQKQIQLLKSMKEPPKQNVLQYQSYMKCQQRLLELTKPMQKVYYKRVQIGDDTSDHQSSVESIQDADEQRQKMMDQLMRERKLREVRLRQQGRIQADERIIAASTDISSSQSCQSTKTPGKDYVYVVIPPEKFIVVMGRPNEPLFIKVIQA